MRILLDTHVFLWSIKDDRKLSKPARQKILHATEVYVSSASIWEAAIKIQLRKLNADVEDLIEAIPASGFIELPVNANHAAGILKLPHHHRDPFHRILIAQAIYEPLTLLTADDQLMIYSELVEVI